MPSARTVLSAAVAAPLAAAWRHGSSSATNHNKLHSSEYAYDLPGPVQESSRRPLLPNLDTSRQRYGSTSSSPTATGTWVQNSPAALGRDSLLNRVPEEMEYETEERTEGYTDGAPLLPGDESDDELEAWDWELEQRGLYRGSYRRLVALYTTVPLSTIFAFVLLALLPKIFYECPHDPPDPYDSRLPAPFPELLTAVSLYCLSHLLRVPLYSLGLFLTTFLPYTFAPNELPMVLSTTFHVLVATILRILAIPLLEIPQKMTYPRPTWRDPAFRRIWWFALGWGAAEAAVGIAQGYEQLSLYRDVLVMPSKGGIDEEFNLGGRGKEPSIGNGLGQSIGGDGSTPVQADSDSLDTEHEGEGSTNRTQTALPPLTANRAFPRIQDAARLQVDQDLDSLMALRGREEVEEVYGMPFIHIPPFICTLQRLNSLLLSLGLTLLLSSAYLQSSLSLPSSSLIPLLTSITISNPASPFYLILPALLHFLLAMLHTPPLLARLGPHTAAYIGLLGALGALFAGMGVWGAVG